MKIIKRANILIVLTSIFVLSASDERQQERFYYSFDEKTFLFEVPNKVVLRYDGEYFSAVQVLGNNSNCFEVSKKVVYLPKLNLNRYEC